MFWFVFSIIVLFLAFLGQKRLGNVENDYFFVFRCLLILVLSYVTGLGAEIGTDHDHYAEAYKAVSKFGWAEIFQPYQYDPFRSAVELNNAAGFMSHYEYGFVILLKFFSYLGFSELAFFFSIAIICNSLIVFSIFRYPYVVFQVLLFILSYTYGQQVNAVRNQIAIAIFAYSLRYLFENKMLRYVLFLIIAGSFHSSALFVFLFLILIYKLCNRFKYEYIFRLFLLLWLISFLFALNLFTINLGGLGEIISLYKTYTEDSESGSLRLVCNIYALLVILAYYKKLYKPFHFIELCIIFHAILWNITSQFYIFYRLAFYFDVFVFLFIPYILFQIAKNNINNIFLKSLPHLFLFYNVILLFIFRIFNSDKNALGSKIADISELLK